MILFIVAIIGIIIAICSIIIAVTSIFSYSVDLALDENGEIIGYEYFSLGKFTDFLKKGLKAEEALEKAKGTYGRFADGVKYIDPRQE